MFLSAKTGSSLVVQPTWLGGTGNNTTYIATRTEGTSSNNFTIASGNYTVKVWGGGGGYAGGGGSGGRGGGGGGCITHTFSIGTTSAQLWVGQAGQGSTGGDNGFRGEAPIHGYQLGGAGGGPQGWFRQSYTSAGTYSWTVPGTGSVTLYIELAGAGE